jgi:hypothetical protein
MLPSPFSKACRRSRDLCRPAANQPVAMSGTCLHGGPALLQAVALQQGCHQLLPPCPNARSRPW